VEIRGVQTLTGSLSSSLNPSLLSSKSRPATANSILFFSICSLTLSLPSQSVSLIPSVTRMISRRHFLSPNTCVIRSMATMRAERTGKRITYRSQRTSQVLGLTIAAYLGRGTDPVEPGEHIYVGRTGFYEFVNIVITHGRLGKVVSSFYNDSPQHSTGGGMVISGRY
jgi:hypothetical protein